MAEEQKTTPEQSDSQASGDKPKPIQFAMQRIYLKDLSFESPMGAAGFSPASWKPKLGQDINTAVNELGNDKYEVVLKITVSVTVEEKTVFLVEVQQAGLFHVADIEPAHLAHVLNTKAPEILFPYARETIDSCATRGGFPPVMLPPMNFELLFMQAIQKARAEAQANKDQVN